MKLGQLLLATTLSIASPWTHVSRANASCASGSLKFTADTLAAIQKEERFSGYGTRDPHQLAPCFGYVAFPQGQIFLFRLRSAEAAQISYCATEIVWAKNDGIDPRSGLKEGQPAGLVLNLESLDWTNNNCKVYFVRRETGNIAVTKSGGADQSSWFKDKRRDIAVTVTEAYRKPGVADRVAKLLFETQDVRDVQYLGDRGAIAEFASIGWGFVLSSVNSLGPIRLCIENGLRTYRTIDSSLESEVRGYMTTEDQIFRELVVFNHKDMDPAAFAFAC
jgi:hypothetical protein